MNKIETIKNFVDEFVKLNIIKSILLPQTHKEQK